MTALPPELAPLSILASARSKAADYYGPLLDSDDEVLKVGAWCALLDREEISVEQYAQVLELATHGAIQRRAFRFFESIWQHDFAAAVADKVTEDDADVRMLAMRAELACDGLASVEAERRRYLATGAFDALVAMVGKDEIAEGWRAALPLAVKVVVLNPHDPIAASLLLHLIYEAREQNLLRAALGLLREASLHPYLTLAYNAAVQLMQANPRECLKSLGQLTAMRPPRADVLARIRPLAVQVNAEALEKLGDYRKAYEAYVELNRVDQGKPVSLDDFGKVVLAAAAREVPRLPPDPNINHFVMTGFPRSGTTLLENALAAHPRVETFEEIPSAASMDFYLQTMLPRTESVDERVATYLRARERYYDEQTRRRRKPEAMVLIDKMPMRSAEAGSMSKIFPDKRYIFSIRHPFDVVLSCFKQHFSRNIAMEHFRTFEGAVKLYDFTMQQWFSVHGLDDPRVHYVRYDALVTDFEPTIRGALEFLCAPWNDKVRHFAAEADKRSARTPSYQKVRQGLSIGVQTSWRNYGFLFETAAAKPLHAWARFFDYPTE
jgi:tetratricopeptide (TPR) repeat protein